MRGTAGDIVEYCDRGLISIPCLTLRFCFLRSVCLRAAIKSGSVLETKVGGQGRDGGSGATCGLQRLSETERREDSERKTDKIR